MLTEKIKASRLSNFFELKPVIKKPPAKGVFIFTFDLMNMPIHIIFILLSSLVGIFVSFRLTPPSYMRLLPYFLFLTFVVEVIGWQLGQQGINNAIYFNIFSIIFFLYYLYIIYQLLRSRIIKKILLGSMFVFPIVVLINILYVQGPHVFHTITYSIGSLFTIIFCVYFFYELFRIPYAINLKVHPGFWIVTGLLFFNVCTIPFIGLSNYIYQFSPVLINNFQFILSFLNVLLYLLFTIAFLCRISFQRSMS